MDQALTDTVKLSTSDQGNGAWLMIKVGDLWAVGTKLTPEQVEDVTRLLAPSNDTLPSGRSLC